jgi:hypothetical protein
MYGPLSTKSLSDCMTLLGFLQTSPVISLGITPAAYKSILVHPQFDGQHLP